jgi:hypothetical protein
MPRKPKNKNELMKLIEKEWELLIKTAESLSDEQMSTLDSGGWAPKDNLAHLAEWMNILTGYHMDKKPAYKVIGIPKSELKEWSIEFINPFLFARNKDLSRKQVMSKLKRAYIKTHAKLKATPFKDLLKPRHADDPKKLPLLLWVLGDTSEHFKEHRQTIQKGIKTKR